MEKQKQSLGDAVAEFIREPSEDTLDRVADLLGDLVAARGEILVPVDNDGEDRQLRGISDGEGGSNLVAFTGQEEADKGPETVVVSHDLDDFFFLALDSDEVTGVVLDPWSGGCHLDKGLLQMVMERHIPTSYDYLRDNRRLEKAIRFATDCHSGQLRKGSTKPYIVHPLETMQILRQMDADTNLLIAGLLHDTLEDTDATEEEIFKKFGMDVYLLVTHHTEDKSKNWQERKETAIAQLREAPTRLKMLVMADKVANLRSMFQDYFQLGEELWERFNAPKSQQAWYYSGIQDALFDLQTIPETADVYWEMVALFKELFVAFYYNDVTQTLYQVCDDGTSYYLQKNDVTWQPFHGTVPAHAQRISRVEGEDIEDDWADQREIADWKPNSNGGYLS